MPEVCAPAVLALACVVGAVSPVVCAPAVSALARGVEVVSPVVCARTVLVLACGVGGSSWVVRGVAWPPRAFGARPSACAGSDRRAAAAPERPRQLLIVAGAPCVRVAARLCACV